MKIERVKNTKRNLIWGLINKLVSLMLNFLCRTAIIRVFGINYAGLSSLFTSIVSALNLAELGFGSTIVFLMYKAVAEDDEDTLCELLAFFNKAYKIIGVFILVAGLSITPFLEVFIHSDVPKEVDIHIVYIYTIIGTAISYFMYAYRGSILEAYQRKDIILNINSISTIIERILQILGMIILRNYYIFVIIPIGTNILNNMLTYNVVKKEYPNCQPRGRISDSYKSEIWKKIIGLIMYKIGGFVSSSVDSIVVSAFLGLTIMGQYGNYYYVIYAIFSFFTVYYSAIRAGIGNSIIVESKEKNLKDFFTFQFIQNWAVCWCTVCLLCLFQDFMILYAGRENVLSLGIVITICVYFWSWKIQDIVHIYKEASGLWNQDKLRPIIGAGINLVLNLIMVRYIGLYGVLLSTVLVLIFLDLPWASKVLYDNLFHCNRKDYYLEILRNFIETGLLALLTYYLCSFVSTNSMLICLAIKGIICLIVPNLLYYILYRESVKFKHARVWFTHSMKKNSDKFEV